MRHRRSRKFRHSSNGRNFQSRRNGVAQIRISPNSFGGDRGRNNFKTHQNAEKLVDKYKLLAKEALSSGDKILSENYLQHADHFKRIIDERNLNQSKSQETIQVKSSNENLNENLEATQTPPAEEKK